MKIQTITTNIFTPPQYDLFQEMMASDLKLQNGDVVVISSKVVAIHEGRCVPISDQVSKDELVKAESDVYFEDADSRWRICVAHSTFLSSAGIDESNAGGYYVLLPKNPINSARTIWSWLRKQYQIDQVGVVISDSHSVPMRYGTVGISLGWAGFEPVTYFTGKPDLFGRLAQYTRINVADSLAQVGVYAMGELDEQTPIVKISDAPRVTFTSRNTSADLYIPPREDIYWPLIKRIYEQ
jgi:dihydrofolate synthase / folylpolyglutamate synthase